MRIPLLMAVLLVVVGWSVPALAQQPEPVPGGVEPRLPGDFGALAVDRFERASAAMQAEDYPTAILESSVFLLLNPIDAQGYYLRGLSYALAGEPPQALADLDRALAAPSPSDALRAQIRILRAAIFRDQGEADAALAEYNTSIEEAPTIGEVYFRRGTLFLNQEDWAAALADFDQALQLEPQNLDAAYLRGVAHNELGDVEAAINDFSAVIEGNPRDFRAFAARGAAYAEWGNFELAIADFTEALRLEPRAVELYLQRGAAYNSQGDRPLAAEDYTQWAVSIRTEIDESITLRAGESQVVPMAEGRLYIMEFQATAGQTITLSASGEGADPLIVLFDADGVPWLADDDSGGEMNALLERVILPVDGTYGMLVTHAGGGADGPVTVRLRINASP